MQYGNIATADIADKFNGLITESMYNPRIFHLQRHSMLLIRPTEDHTYFVAYNYLLGSATTLKFNIPIDSICETTDDILVCSGRNIYRWSDVFTDDDGKKIEYIFKPKAIISTEYMLIKSVDTKFSSDYAGNASLTEGTLAITVPTNTRNKIRCNHSTECIDMAIASTDRFIVDHILLEVADL